MNRRGFTIVELLSVVVIMGILALIALPSVQETRRRADAVHVIADFSAIRVAALDNYAATSLFPPNGTWGRAPAAFRSSLPGGFKFSYRTVTYRWRRWATAAGAPRSRTGPLIGVSLRGTDAKLMRAIGGIYQGIVIGSGNNVTLVIQ